MLRVTVPAKSGTLMPCEESAEQHGENAIVQACNRDMRKSKQKDCKVL
jgi:hypothetical protein